MRELITVGKTYRSHFTKSVEHIVYRVPSSAHISQELLGLDCNSILVWGLANYKPSSRITVLNNFVKSIATCSGCTDNLDDVTTERDGATCDCVIVRLLVW